jgi:hypothetical protein
MSTKDQEKNRESGTSGSAFVTLVKTISTKVVAASSLAHRTIGFFGKHPFVTGLLAVIGVFGFALSIVSYQRDREDSRTTNIQVGRVEEALETIQSEIRGAETSDALGNAPPEWVTEGCVSYFRDANPQRYCGVGTASGIGDLARSVAITRARAAIAQTLESRVNVSLAPGTDSGDSASDIETRTNAILSGARVLEIWAAPDGTFHALVVYYDSRQIP